MLTAFLLGACTIGGVVIFCVAAIGVGIGPAAVLAAIVGGPVLLVGAGFGVRS